MNKATRLISSRALRGRIPLAPSTRDMASTKQILIRVTNEQHEALAKKASVAGVSVPSLIRDHLNRIKVAESRTYARLEQLLLARIGTQLEIVAEQCRNHDDKAMVLEIIACLTGIERELNQWKERSGRCS